MRWSCVITLSLVACAGRAPEPQPASTASSDGCQSGDISYYAASLAGNKTANGDIYDPEALTAAHRTLPFGSRVKVTVGERSVALLVNDRGPYAKQRILDVSGRAARELDLMKVGHAPARVCVE